MAEPITTIIINDNEEMATFITTSRPMVRALENMCNVMPGAERIKQAPEGFEYEVPKNYITFHGYPYEMGK